MTHQEVIRRLCALATEVGEAHDHTLSHDCFCGENVYSGRVDDFRFEVLEFIEEAVREKIARRARTVTGDRNG